MATWMVHLRIADKLLDKLCNLSYTEFIVGNIAPDSGVPNDDWSEFFPSGDISHFKTTDVDGLKDIHYLKSNKNEKPINKKHRKRVEKSRKKYDSSKR